MNAKQWKTQINNVIIPQKKLIKLNNFISEKKNIYIYI